MLRIKSLGFNTVIHYCYFDNNGTVDMDGTMPKLLNNCLSAGLNVVINTNIESSLKELLQRLLVGVTVFQTALDIA